MSRRISIGIDCDGVMRSFTEQFAKYAREFYDIKLTEDDYKEWGYPNVLDPQGRKLVTHVFAKPEIGRFIYEGAPPITNAYTAYKKFVDHPAFEVYVVTSQKKGYEEFTENWLNKHGFTDHIKTFYESNKLNAPVQMLIDDKLSHIEKFFNNQRDGLLINQPYNEDEQVDYPRADDLLDAYNVILNMYQRYI